jgi:hypothetical protein
MLLQDDLLIYCGHGSGERIMSREAVEAIQILDQQEEEAASGGGGGGGATGRSKFPSHAVLMGCSSGYLHLYGEFEPNGYAQSLLLSGTSCLVANLWDVTDKDIDLFTECLLKNWTSGFTSSPPSSSMESGMRLSLPEVVHESRRVCKMKGLSSCAPVCYGLPVLCTFD